MVDIANLPLLGLDWRDAMERLNCTRPELFRWIEEGKLPYDGRVHSYQTVEGGWKPSTIEKAKAFVEVWRAGDKCKRSTSHPRRVCGDSVRETAKLLDSYIRFRAKHEGVGYELNPEFFAKRIRDGISKFFGVSFIYGKLLSDEEFPMLFDQWNGERQRETKSYR